MVTELCTGGELFDMIVNRGAAFSEKKACGLMHQLMLAVNYIHVNKVIHRNIKPENILLEQNNKGKYHPEYVLKLIGFG